MFKASTRIEISMPLDRNSHIHVTAKVKAEITASVDTVTMVNVTVNFKKGVENMALLFL